MNACSKFCEQLADLVFSGQKNEVIMQQATLMLRSILEEYPEKEQIALDGFRKDLLDKYQNIYHPTVTTAENIDHPESYNAGEKVGLALGKAMNGKMDRMMLKNTLSKILCEE